MIFYNIFLSFICFFVKILFYKNIYNPNYIFFIIYYLTNLITSTKFLINYKNSFYIHCFNIKYLSIN